MKKIFEDFLIVIFGIVLPVLLLIKLLNMETETSPTRPPSRGPTTRPTTGPTAGPSRGPTTRPTTGPTAGPSRGPTTGPSRGPTVGPTAGPTSSPNNNMLYAISNNIKSDINNLKSHPPCQDDNSRHLVSDIIQLSSKAYAIINNKDDPPSPSSIDYFNNILNSATEMIKQISSLPQCNCPQGTYGSDGSCVCPPAYPYPLLGSDGITIYCSNVLCKNINHGKFVPDMGADPSKNQCLCDTGYTHDDIGYPKDPQCYNLPFSNTLKTYGDNIKDDMSQLKKDYLG